MAAWQLGGCLFIKNYLNEHTLYAKYVKELIFIIFNRIYQVCGKSNQMNEELAVASNMQVDSATKWESLCESLNSLGNKTKYFRLRLND